MTLLINEIKLAQENFPLLSDEKQAALLARVAWLSTAKAHQLPPKDEWWSIWLLLAGRGAGKTRAAAEWTWWEGWKNEGIRLLVSAPTAADIRDVCFEGDSGIMNVVPIARLQKFTQ